MPAKVTVIAYEKNTARSYADLLHRLFGAQVSVKACSLEDGTYADGAGTGIILASTHSIYGLAKQCVGTYDDIIIADLALPRSAAEELYRVPTGTGAMLVNTTMEMAVETIGLIYNSGVTHIDFVPVYPGLADIPRLTLAVTPGEIALVPSVATQVIDLGDRSLSVRTIANVAAKLGLADMLGMRRFQDYFQSLTQGDLGLESLLGQVGGLEKQLDLVMRIFGGGVLALNAAGRINFISGSAEDLLSLQREAALGRDAGEVVPALGELGPQGVCTPIRDKLVTVGGQLLAVSVYPVTGSASEPGYLLLLKRLSDIEREQDGIRRQIIAKGHVAKHTFDDIAGVSESIRALKEKARKMALSSSGVLITGQSGTGKELFAQSVHNASPRREWPFIAINCASIPESLLESELFGYSEGAFTGAKKGGKVGYFELAHKGTLFLDEVGELGLPLQARLLRVLQEKEVIRVGGDRVINIDVRVVSATNRDLKELVALGKFRRDLYYRLNVLSIQIPPLSHRREDIPVLLELLRRRLGADFSVSSEAMELITACPWEGNVRELGNFVERVGCLGKSVVGAADAAELLETAGMPCSPEPDAGQRAAAQRFVLRYGAAVPRYRSVMEVLSAGRKPAADNQSGREHLGRRSIAARLEGSGMPLSEQETRTILRDLEAEGFVLILRGRGGTVLTELGVGVLPLLSQFES